MTSRTDLPYRPCAGAMLINRAGLVFVGHRKHVADMTGTPAPWQMPQGGIDDGESPLDAARRELWEETSVRSIELIGEAPDWYRYDVPDDIAAGRFRKKWRGQTQKWFAFRFLGDDAEIDVDHPGGGAHPAEFSHWAWKPLAEVPSLIVPFKRPVYEKVCAALAHLAVPA